jgi:AcrR family transcriptional regulator
MVGGRHAIGAGSGTPRGELTRIRDSRERQAEEIHARILDAMLATCGDKGYRRVAVQDVIDRYEGNRVQFYRHFASKADCYEAAYEHGVERLVERIFEAAKAAAGWRLGLRAGLGELACFAEESPLVARGLLVEVHVAGGPALLKRSEVCERLAHAIDGARREAGAGSSPPPITAQFMVGAIESTVVGALAAREPQAFTAAVPELAHMVVSTYLGEEAAGEELAAATAA